MKIILKDRFMKKLPKTVITIDTTLCSLSENRCFGGDSSFLSDRDESQILHNIIITPNIVNGFLSS